MRQAFHDPQLIVDFNVQCAVLDETTLLYLLNSNQLTSVSPATQVHNGKSPLADKLNDIVGIATIPVHARIITHGTSCQAGRLLISLRVALPFEATVLQWI